MQQAEQAFALASGAQSRKSADCVDAYFRSVTYSYHTLLRLVPSDDPRYRRAWQLYHGSLAHLIQEAQEHGRFDAQRGLLLNLSGGPRAVPVVQQGFPWRPEDFNSFVPVGAYRTTDLSRTYRREGLGVPLLVFRVRAAGERFMQPAQPFAATALMRPELSLAEPGPTGSAAAQPSVPVLELYDPLRIGFLNVGGRRVALASDISAPLAYRPPDRQRSAWRGFVQPDDPATSSKLIMIEPYQPGRIPVVFVHGLLSEAPTWKELGNELRADPRIPQRFQLWAFQYPTGQPFLRSAAELRRELSALAAALDPHGRDPALRNVVLIGHSMGGLVSKLQVTSSGDTLWRSVANRPLESIVADPSQRAALRDSFFFGPLPQVRRVVFIGTPHKGSRWAARGVGRIGSSLVSWDAQRREAHRRLIQDNPDTFDPGFRRGIPTSVDLLRPDTSLLLGIRQLPVDPGVRLHSIAGVRQASGQGSTTDGVVPLSSAAHPGVVSQKVVDAEHSAIHRHPETIDEVKRILIEHLAEYDALLAGRS